MGVAEDFGRARAWTRWKLLSARHVGPPSYKPSIVLNPLFIFGGLRPMMTQLPN
ncbi:MAG: hypothetical protein JWN10_2517 [Solirubrobacterales bacterium]|nr:hypothetical protein [Solirubrobacterales bacterium]